jgi:hypothetical protein
MEKIKAEFKPKIVESKCIFYLEGTTEKKNLYNVSVNAVDVNDGIYTMTSNGSYVHYNCKDSNIVKPTTNAFSISFWIKKKRPSGYPYEEFGFDLGYGLNFGISNDTNQMYTTNVLYVDDGTIAATNSRKIEEINPTVDQNDWILYTICRDKNNKLYFSMNGRQYILKASSGVENTGFMNGGLSNLYDMSRIVVGGVDGGYSFIGSIDQVIIHKDVCLYTENFSITPIIPLIKLY